MKPHFIYKTAAARATALFSRLSLLFCLGGCTALRADCSERYSYSTDMHENGWGQEL